jgi:hypothetical protein
MAAMARVKIPSASGPSTCITMHLYTASRMHASAADRPSNLVRLHDMSETQAVPQRFRPVLSALIDMIAEGDVAAMRADPAIRVGVSDPLAMGPGLSRRGHLTAAARVGSRRRGAGRRAT